MSEDELQDYYGTYNHYIKSIARGHHDAFMCVAPHGLGKSYQAVETLEEEVGSDKYYKFPAVTSPFEFYKKLWEIENSSVEVLFMDDIEGLLRDDRALSILKQATWSETGTRVVGWNSSDGKMTDSEDREIPQRFVFTGRIIMIFNEVPDGPIFDSLQDRCFYHEMDFTWEERCDMIRQVARKGMGEGITEDKRQEIAEFLISSVSPADPKDLNMRTLKKAFMHYKSCADIDSGLSWREVISDTISIDEEMCEVRDILYDDSFETVAARKQEFKDRTGSSGRTYLRKRKQLQEHSQKAEEHVQSR